MLKWLRKVGRGIKRVAIKVWQYARQIAKNPGVQKAAGEVVKKRYGTLAGAGVVAALAVI